MDNEKFPEDAPYSRKRRSPAKAAADQAEESAPRPEETPERFKDPTPLMLINEIAHLFGEHMRSESTDFALGGSYRSLLFHLAIRDGRTQLELARLTHLKAPTVSLSLAKLEAEGYVTRRADPDDLRQTRVYLTERGLDVDRRAREAIDKIEAKAAESLTDGESAMLKKTLAKLRDNLSLPRNKDEKGES